MTPVFVDRTPAGTWKLIVAASIGNALEWFDLAVHGFLAPFIAHLFFPASGRTGGLVLALGTFAVSYAARPLGALWLGSLADRRGRKVALTWAIVLMGSGSAMIAMAPTYAQAGMLGAYVLVVARILQGVSAGGEFGAATALLVEHLPRRSGFMGSWQVASQGMSTLLASLAGLLVSALSTSPTHATWAWRVPFVFGVLVAPVGLYIRNHLPDAQGAEHATKAGAGAGAGAGRRPLLRVLGERRSELVQAIALMMGSTSATYVIVYLPTYVRFQLGASANAGYGATLAAGGLLTLLPPLVGACSDRHGRLAAMLPSAVVLCLTSVPLFLWLERAPTAANLLVSTVWLAAWKAIYFGGLPATLAELFPSDLRATGLNIAYSIGVPIFGGLAPLFLTLLREHHVPAAPGLYVALMSACSLAAIGPMRRRSRRIAEA